MNIPNSAEHSNNNTLSPCALCEGIFAHQAWCASRDPGASYPYQIVLDASKISPGDSLILHSLGVVWAEVNQNLIFESRER